MPADDLQARVDAAVADEIQARVAAAVAVAIADALKTGVQRREAILRHEMTIDRPTLGAWLAFMSDVSVDNAVAILAASPLENAQRAH